MSSFAQHPDGGVLLRYLDGELPGRKAKQVQKHLEACWQCRTELEELQSAVADCMRYRKAVLPLMPEPPAPWRDLSRGFAEIDAQQALPRFSWAWLKWGLATAAVAAVACAVVYQLRFTPSVRAATLLKQAVTATEQRPAAPHDIRVRTKGQVFLRTVDRRHGEPALPVALAARFEAARYDISDPLSPRPFEAWRANLSGRHDAVSTVADPEQPTEHCYKIETIADSGDIASATIMLRTRDFSPVESKFEFRDQDWVEFSEMTDSPVRSNDSPVATRLETPLRPAEPSRRAAEAPRPSASVTDELQVLSALHQIGADLGDPVEVKLSGDRVLVSGIGVPAARQRQIEDALNGLPHVAVQFSDGSAGVPLNAQQDNGTVPPPAAPANSTAAEAKLQARIAEQLGGRAEMDRFASRVLDLDESVMSRAYALRSLAQRFPAGNDGGMTATDRASLRQLAGEYLGSMTSQVSTMQRALGPVLKAVGAGNPGRRAAANAPTWQAAAEEVLRNSRRVEVLLSDVLGVASTASPGAASPGELLGAMADLQGSLESCQILAGK